MTENTVERSREALPDPGHHVRLLAQVRAEWIKMRSIRSTWVCLLLIFIIGVGLSVVISIVSASAWKSGGADRLQYDPVRTAQAGVLVAQFIVGVLGALSITGEYSSGLVRTTLTSVTHRWNVLVAKVLVVGGVLFVVGELTAFASYFVSRVMLLSHGGRVVATDSPLHQDVSKYIPVLNLSSPGVLRATMLAGVYLVLLGLGGLALGFLIRHSAGTISVYVGLLLVVPVVVQLLPTSISAHFNSYMPNTIGSAMLVVTLRHNAYGGTFLGPTVATTLLGGYVIVLLLAGLWRLERSDA